MDDLSRRVLLRAAALAPLAGACARRIDTDREVDVAAAVDGDVSVPLTAAPELGTAGGAVRVRPAGSSVTYLVACTGAGYFALTALCPHQGCPVAWVPEDRQAECPCHGSRFASDGTVLNPPATADLRAYPAELSGGNVVVHLFAGDGVFPGKVQNGQYSFAVASFPALATQGGVVVGQPAGFPGPIAVSRTFLGNRTDAFTVVTAVCPHLGCTVFAGGPGLACPCHGSTFQLNGAFVQGPAGGPLAKFPSSFDGTTLTISTT